jgi:hypothetical protein
MDRQLVTGVVGSLLLGLGVFAPIISLPIVGGVNYFRNGTGDGVFVLALAGISLILSIRRRFHWLFTTGTSAIALLIGTFLGFLDSMVEMERSVARDLADNPFRSLADAAVGSVQIQWGWALLVFSAGILMAAAVLRDKPANSRKCPHCAELIKFEAVVCKHCNREVEAQAVPVSQAERRLPRRVVIATVMAIVVIGAVTWTSPLLTLLIRIGAI